MKLPKPEPVPEGDIAPLPQSRATEYAKYGPEISASLGGQQLDLLRLRDETWKVGRKQEVESGQVTMRPFWRGLTEAQARRVAAALLQAGCGSATWLPANAPLPEVPDETRLSIMRYLVRDLRLVRISIIDIRLRPATILPIVAWEDRSLVIHPAVSLFDRDPAWTVTAPTGGLALISTARLSRARAASTALQEVCSDWTWSRSADLSADLRGRLERAVRHFQR